MKSILKTSFGIVFAFVGMVVVGEGFVRILSENQLIYNIEMVKYASKLKVPHPNPLFSHRHKPNAGAKLMGVEIKLNNLGQRAKPVSLEKPASRHRILALGSSVTMGWGVENEKVFTSVAENSLKEDYRKRGLDLEVINAGIGNYSLEQQLQLFKEQYPLVKPDQVVLHYFVSDVEDKRIRKNNPVFKHLYLATYLHQWFEGVRYQYSRKVSLLKYYKDLYDTSSPAWNRTLEYLSEFKATLDKDKVPFLVMIIPDFHNLSTESPYQEFYTQVEKACTDRKISALNLFEDFQKTYGGKEAELWIQADDPHPNAKAHDLMGKALQRYLQKSESSLL